MNDCTYQTNILILLDKLRALEEVDTKPKPCAHVQ